MIQKKLLKLAIVGLTAGLFLSAQTTQTNKEVPPSKKEIVIDNDVQLLKADTTGDQKEVAMMQGTKEPVGEMQKFDTQESCGKSAPCKTCNECTPSKPCKTCNKCEPKQCSKPAPCKTCNECTPSKPCKSCKKCDDSSKSCKGAAKTAVDG